MSEPIAVAFVEVRPETDQFKANAERDLQGLADDVTIRGQVKLDGLTTAQREVSNLGQELSGLAGQQLQFPGLEDAAIEAARLGDAVANISTVSVRPQFEPLLQDVGRLRQEADDLSASLAAIPAGFNVDTQGIDEAVSGAEALDAAQSGLGDTLGTSATAASALIAKYPQLAAGEQQVARATARSTAEARAAQVEEQGLIRLRSRRAASVGPLRLAGIGLGAGVGLFAATQALGALADGLRVTGDEASTFEGRMRNAGASLLGGDVVGAFKALTSETHEYTAAQLELINQSPQLEEALRSIGQGANIAKARTAELARLAENPVPQFIQTQVAVARESGDPAALRAALERASASVDDALDRAKSLRTNQRSLVREIESRREELRQVRAAIDRLGQDDSGGGPSPIAFGRAAAFAPLAQLEAREKQLQEELAGFVRRRQADLPAFNAAREALANVKRQQKEAIQDAIRQESEDVLAPLAEAVTDARLTGSSSRILAALRAQAASLRQVIAGFKGSAEDRKRFKDDLVGVNKTIEATQKDINAEAERHQQAMLDNRLAPTEEAIIDAQVAGASTVGARQARIAQIEAILAAGEINGKKLTRDQRVALKNELVAQNAAIESEQDAITAENERHRQAMQDKLDKADKAFLAALGGRETALRNQQAIEQARAGLQGDIRVSNELQRFFAESIRVARKTIHDKEQRDSTVASLRADLASEQQNERGLRAQQRQEAADRQTERADLAIELARTNEDRGAEIKAHQAKINLLRERIANTRRGSIERKRLRVAIAAERADIRRLREEAEKDKKDEKATSSTSLADLFTQQNDINRQRSFAQQLLRPKIGDVTQPIEDRVTSQIQKVAGVVPVKSPFERNDDRMVNSQEKLTAAIERLTGVIGSSGAGGSGGGTPTPADVVGMRWDAAARFWQSRRGKQLAQETASA